MRARPPRRALLGLGWNDPIKRAVRWAVLSPFRAARWVYGPYGLSTLPLQLGLERGLPAGGVLDVALERILTARTMVAVGALALVVQLTLVGDRGLSSITEWLWGCLVDGGVAMVLAPVPVLVIAIVLIAIARPEQRRGRARAALRPCMTAIATLALMLGCLVAFPPLDRSGTLDRIENGQSIDLAGIGTLPPLVTSVLMVAIAWIGLFILASAYLVHRNGLGASRDLPLLPPLATIGIVWAVPLLGETTNVIDVTTLSGWQHLAETYGTPIVVTALAAGEILRLRWVNGIGFRGPMPAAAPAEPVPPVEAP